MGDYSINYLNTREKQDLETVILPFSLIVSNTDQPTRIEGTVLQLLFPTHLSVPPAKILLII